ADALRRGPRPIPTAHTLVRDLLSAVEHAHARGVILRRIVPLTLMLELSGRAVITDLRYANWCLPNVPPEERGAGGAFVAPEVRAGGPGEPASDVDAVAGGGGLRATAAARPGRRLRAARGNRRGRIRAGVSGARPRARARRGDQGPPPVAHRRCHRDRALPPRGAARGAAAAPEHRQ